MTHSACAHELAFDNSTPEVLEAGSEDAASEKQPESDLLQRYEVVGEMLFWMLEELDPELPGSMLVVVESATMLL